MTDTTLATSNGATLGKPAGGVTFKQMLESRRDLIASVLPKHMTPERLIKLATVAIGRVPKLGRCTGVSVVSAVIKAAELGLDCSGTLGSAYLVPFDRSVKTPDGWTKISEAQLIIGYRGLIDLARRSGQIVSIEARVVWANDEFDFEYGLEPRLIHKPIFDGDPGEFRLVYGIAKLRDGGTQVEVMSKHQIDAVRARSMAKDKGPWVTDYPEMARKTVIKRLAKYLPLSVEFAEAMEVDNRTEREDLIEGQLVSAADRLNAKLMEGKQEAAIDEVPEEDAADPPPPDDVETIDHATGEVLTGGRSGVVGLAANGPRPREPAPQTPTTPADQNPGAAAQESPGAIQADEAAQIILEESYGPDVTADERKANLFGVARMNGVGNRKTFDGALFKFAQLEKKSVDALTFADYAELDQAIRAKAFDWATGRIDAAKLATA